MMEYLNWIAEHWLLTIVLAVIVFGNLSWAFGGAAPMIVTEEEAKSKRCQEGFGPSSEMRNSGVATALWTQPAFCIGSACMAWRWHHRDEPAREDIKTSQDWKAPTQDAGWTFVEGSETGSSWSRNLAAVPGTGYCGKAGTP